MSVMIDFVMEKGARRYLVMLVDGVQSRKYLLWWLVMLFLCCSW
jgi:hypothetical protein